METPGAAPHTPFPTCVVSVSGADVLFAVNGNTAQTMPVAAYDAMEQELAGKGAVSAFLLEAAPGVTLKVQLPPLLELKTGPVELYTDDGLRFGRHYKITGTPTEAGKSYFLIADAFSGAEVEKMPRETFAGYAKRGLLRSATPYPMMLGEFSDRLYYNTMGDIYHSESYARPALAAAATAPAEKPRPPEEEASTPVAAGRSWILTHPKVAYIAAAAGLLIFGISLVIYLVALPSGDKIKLDWDNARSVDYYINTHMEIAQYLSATDFREYWRQQPQAARENLDRLTAFIDGAEKARLTEAQADKIKKMRAISDKLQEAAQ